LRRVARDGPSLLAARILDRSGNGGSIRRTAVAVCPKDRREAERPEPRVDRSGLMPAPDLFPAFQRLTPEERETVVAWADALGLEPEECPPLASLVEAVAAVRFVDAQEGTRERAWLEAGRLLKLDRPETVRARIEHWRRRARSSVENLCDGPDEGAQVSSRR
jgi:hypothetical protein